MGVRKEPLSSLLSWLFYQWPQGLQGPSLYTGKLVRIVKKKPRCREVHRIFGYFRDDLIFVVFLTFILRSQYNTRNNNKLKSVLFAIKKIFTKRLTNKPKYCDRQNMDIRGYALYFHHLFLTLQLEMLNTPLRQRLLQPVVKTKNFRVRERFVVKDYKQKSINKEQTQNITIKSNIFPNKEC